MVWAAAELGQWLHQNDGWRFDNYEDCCRNDNRTCRLGLEREDGEDREEREQSGVFSQYS
jgi:hypothetical protein